MVSTLLDQVDREEEQQQQSYPTSSTHFQSQPQPQSQNRPQTEKLQFLQAQMSELENRTEHQRQQRYMGLDLDDEEIDDDYSTDSTSYLSESFHSSVYDIMPLAGMDDDDDYHLNKNAKDRVVAIVPTSISQLEEPQQLPNNHKDHQPSNNPSLREFLERSHHTTPCDSPAVVVVAPANEQLVTKIGQTRLNRTLRSLTASSVGGGGSVVTSDSPSVCTTTPEQEQHLQLQQYHHHHHHHPTPQQNPGLTRNLSKQSFYSAPCDINCCQDHGSNYSSESTNYSFSNHNYSNHQRNALEADDSTLCDSHKGAICVVDISGFTNLSRALSVEDLSKVSDDED
jgi:hypothetical protein